MEGRGAEGKFVGFVSSEFSRTLTPERFLARYGRIDDIRVIYTLTSVDTRDK
jgi:hypothetical protein